ncbi:MAG: hypothetical protein KDD38_05395, partial [Bdellovibrionales bacterium]|nr:hypothetical protein [Bdellovibrionales bacterium]
DPLAIKPVQCFDFNRKTIDVGVKLNQKQARVNQVVRVMIEAAVFLKQYHVYSMGQISSLLFQPLDVEVCSLNVLGRKIELQESVLKIGYKYTMVGSLNADYSAKNITQDWNDGLIVKPNDRPGSAMLSAIKRKFTGEINPDIIEDAEYAKWVVLNPQGKVRRTIRNVILPTIKERIHGLVAYGRRKARADHLDSNSVKSSDEIRAQLQLLTQHKGFSVEMRNYIEREAAEEDLNIIYQDFISKINSSLFLGQSILYASSSARMGQCESMNATVQANRKQSAFINMINAKNIGVNLSTLGIRTDQMDKFLVDENESDDSEGGQCTQSVSVNDVQEGGLVSINLIDNVMVFVKLPSRPGERLSYLALYEVLEKHMNNQGYLNYSR